MRVSVRQLVFIICVAAAVMSELNGNSLLFGLAAFVAFGNLLSSQLMCVLDGCRLQEELLSWRNPAQFAFIINRSTGVVGAMLLIHALVDRYWQIG